MPLRCKQTGVEISPGKHLICGYLYKGPSEDGRLELEICDMRTGLPLGRTVALAPAQVDCEEAP